MIEIEDRIYEIELRRETFDLPFEIKLLDFTREVHPGTKTPRVFSSEVVVRRGTDEQRALISMNEPLRRDGHVLYQTNWGPQQAWEIERGVPPYSVLAVSKNTSDQWPRWSCYTIAAGLIIHFLLKLIRFVSVQRVRTT